MKYKAFISYRHSTGGHHARALETALKRYAKPILSRPVKIFRDEKHLTPGGGLKKSIDEGLKNSEYLIFLAERASANSAWCQKELEDWCNPAMLNRSGYLIIVLIDDFIAFDGIEQIQWEGTTALPTTLQPYLNTIPLYIDFREVTNENANLKDAKYRHGVNALAARLRGVSPEDLNDEEIKTFRRNIRLKNGGLVVLSLMLLISFGTTIWALYSQRKAEVNALEARRQEELANANASEAKKQQEIAETNAVETKKQQQIAEANSKEAKKQQRIAEKNLADRIEQERQKERLNFEKYLNDGDVFANSGDFQIALRYYLKADSILIKFPNDPKLSEKKEMLSQKIFSSSNNNKLKQ